MSSSDNRRLRCQPSDHYHATRRSDRRDSPTNSQSSDGEEHYLSQNKQYSQPSTSREKLPKTPTHTHNGSNTHTSVVNPPSKNSTQDYDTRSNAVGNLPHSIQRYIPTAKLFVQAIALTRNPWPTRGQTDDIIDEAWTNAVLHHNRTNNASVARLSDRQAREILKKRITAARGYLVTTSRRNLPILYDLRLENPESVKQRVQELLKDDRFAAKSLDDGRMAYFTCDQIVDIIQTQYFDKEEFMGRHNLTRRYFQPLTQVTISLAATALLCALENLREGQAPRGNPVPFDSVTYKDHFDCFQSTWSNMSQTRSTRITTLLLQRISNRTSLRNDDSVRLNGHKDTFGEDCDDLGEDTNSQLTQRQPNPPVVPALLNPKSPEEVNQQSDVAESLPDDQPPLIQRNKRSHSNKTTRLPASHSQPPSTAPHSKKRRRRNGPEISRPSPPAVAAKQLPNTVDSETDDDRAVNFSFTQQSEGTRLRSKQLTVSSGSSSDEHE